MKDSSKVMLRSPETIADETGCLEVGFPFFWSITVSEAIKQRCQRLRIIIFLAGWCAMVTEMALVLKRVVACLSDF